MLGKEGVDFELGPTEVNPFLILADSLRPPESSPEDPSDQVGVIAFPNVKFIGRCDGLRREDEESVAEVHLPKQVPVNLYLI